MEARRTAAALFIVSAIIIAPNAVADALCGGSRSERHADPDSGGYTYLHALGRADRVADPLREWCPMRERRSLK
jgi:hypothetical protein